jgi:hypothetical protein
MDFVTDATIYIFGSVFLYITILPLIKKNKREDKKTTKKRKNKN